MLLCALETYKRKLNVQCIFFYLFSVAFKSYDLNNDGFVTREELSKKIKQTLEVAKKFAEEQAKAEAKKEGMPTFILGMALVHFFIFNSRKEYLLL